MNEELWTGVDRLIDRAPSFDGIAAHGLYLLAVRRWRQTGVEVPPSFGLEELHDVAIANLTSRSEAISAHAAQDESGQVNLILFQTMDGYDASRLLLPTLHERLRPHLGSPFAAGIPNRDILLCFRNDPENADRLAKQIAEDYQRMPHQVTDKLVLVTQDGIAPRD
jgi:hypothetical protein